MRLTYETHQITSNDYLDVWAHSFLTAKTAEGLSPRTLRDYRQKLAIFSRYCDGQAIDRIGQLTAAEVRAYLLALMSPGSLSRRGHSPEGVNTHYRVIKAFLRWYELEAEPEGWRNPIRKVRPMRVDTPPRRGVPISVIEQMQAATAGSYALRDRAVLLALLDTGARAGEFLALTLDRVDLASGDVVLVHTKTRTPRLVQFGRKTRRAVRAYLKTRRDNDPHLWLNRNGEGLGYEGLREIILRLAAVARVTPPTLHDFRRACALALHRAGRSLPEISRYLGHSSYTVTRRYLALDDDDVRRLFRSGGPVDHSDL